MACKNEVESAEIRLRYVAWASCGVLRRACGGGDASRNWRNAAPWKTKVTSLVQSPMPVYRGRTRLMRGSANATIKWLVRERIFFLFLWLRRGNSWRIAKFAPRNDAARRARPRPPSLSFPRGHLRVILWRNGKNPQTKNKGTMETPTWRTTTSHDVTTCLAGM